MNEAFKDWCGNDWDKERMKSCWQAACEWQKQQDAEICRRLPYQDNDMISEACIDAILNQGK